MTLYFVCASLSLVLFAIPIMIMAHSLFCLVAECFNRKNPRTRQMARASLLLGLLVLSFLAMTGWLIYEGQR